MKIKEWIIENGIISFHWMHWIHILITSLKIDLDPISIRFGIWQAGGLELKNYRYEMHRMLNISKFSSFSARLIKLNWYYLNVFVGSSVCSSNLWGCWNPLEVELIVLVAFLRMLAPFWLLLLSTNISNYSKWNLQTNCERYIISI